MSLEFEKLNKNYAPDPNITVPSGVMDGDNLTLTFPLNYFIYKQFKDGDQGKIIFKDCLMYRIGSPNDEGFFIDPKNPGRMKNNSRWNYTDFPELEFHNFYIVKNSDWQTSFGPDVIVNKQLKDKIKDPENLNHYLCFMKEGTFECIARSYEEEIPTKALEKHTKDVEFLRWSTTGSVILIVVGKMIKISPLNTILQFAGVILGGWAFYKIFKPNFKSVPKWPLYIIAFLLLFFIGFIVFYELYFRDRLN